MRQPEPGDVVTYLTLMGTERTVRVLGTAEIAGQPAFDGEILGGRADGLRVWGYVEDIQSFQVAP